MEFTEITEKEYEKYWENHPLKTFMSAPKIAKLRERNNWKAYFVGVKEKKKIIAATMLLSHKRRFNVNEFYSPRGFLLDFNNKELLEFFVKEVKDFVHIQEDLERISINVETLQLWAEQMLANGAIDMDEYNSYKNRKNK